VDRVTARAGRRADWEPVTDSIWGLPRMTSDYPPPNPPAPLRARRWSPPPSRPHGPYRLAFRLIGIPIIAVLAVFLYRGLRPHFALPECDSDTAKKTLAQVLKELKLEPVRYAPIKTVSSSQDKVVCSAVMPLSDGASVVADYTFYWQGDKANMRYSIHRQAPQKSSLGGTRFALERHRDRAWIRQ